MHQLKINTSDIDININWNSSETFTFVGHKLCTHMFVGKLGGSVYLLLSTLKFKFIKTNFVIEYIHSTVIKKDFFATEYTPTYINS